MGSFGNGSEFTNILAEKSDDFIRFSMVDTIKNQSGKIGAYGWHVKGSEMLLNRILFWFLLFDDLDFGLLKSPEPFADLVGRVIACVPGDSGSYKNDGQ